MTKPISGSYSTTYTLTDRSTTVLGTGAVSVLLVIGALRPHRRHSVDRDEFRLRAQRGGVRALASNCTAPGPILRITPVASSLAEELESTLYDKNGTVVNHGAIRRHQRIFWRYPWLWRDCNQYRLIRHHQRHRDEVYLNAGGVAYQWRRRDNLGRRLWCVWPAGIALLTNAGTIHGGTGAGIRLTKGAIVTNQATGQIISDRGPGAEFISYSATLTNYGTITGGGLGQDAVLFAPGIGNLLVH